MTSIETIVKDIKDVVNGVRANKEYIKGMYTDHMVGFDIHIDGYSLVVEFAQNLVFAAKPIVCIPRCMVTDGLINEIAVIIRDALDKAN